MLFFLICFAVIMMFVLHGNLGSELIAYRGAGGRGDDVDEGEGLFSVAGLETV